MGEPIAVLVVDRLGRGDDYVVRLSRRLSRNPPWPYGPKARLILSGLPTTAPGGLGAFARRLISQLDRFGGLNGWDRSFVVLRGDDALPAFLLARAWGGGSWREHLRRKLEVARSFRLLGRPEILPGLAGRVTPLPGVALEAIVTLDEPTSGEVVGWVRRRYRAAGLTPPSYRAVSRALSELFADGYVTFTTVYSGRDGNTRRWRPTDRAAGEGERGAV